jgi:hypothetical protein
MIGPIVTSFLPERDLIAARRSIGAGARLHYTRCGVQFVAMPSIRQTSLIIARKGMSLKINAAVLPPSNLVHATSATERFLGCNLIAPEVS